MTTSYFSPLHLSPLDKERIPNHVAFIPDGNRRWAKERSESNEKGHEVGVNTLLEIVKAAKELGIRALTFYLFSTENWNRSKEEIAALMWLLEAFLRDQCEEMKANGVKLKTIGFLVDLPNEVQLALSETKQATNHCQDIEMILALNYGGRDDLRRAFLRILEDYQSNHLKKEEITESLISSYLDTASWQDPDLLIRTSGEMRISNFLLWQLSYTEIYIADVLWPNFTPQHLLEAIIDFQKRERRLGGK